MRILSYVKAMDACSYHRVHLPNQFIDAEIRTSSQLNEDDLAWCDILIYSRHTPVAVALLNQMREKHGFKIVVDTDDWWVTHKEHPKHEFFEKTNIGLQIMQHLANADAVIATHERLAEEVPNRNVYIIPNLIPYGEDQFVYKKTSSKKVRLLYASTIMNYYNTDLIADAMHELADLNIEIVIAGYHDSPLYDVVIKNLTASGKIPYRTVDMLPVREYMTGYDGDIMILPSKNNKFNSMKSNLKILEAAALRMPVVVSKCDPYLNMPVNYFSNNKEFVHHVRNLVIDRKYRKAKGLELYMHCNENYNMKNSNRLSVYEDILQRNHSDSR